MTPATIEPSTQQSLSQAPEQQLDHLLHSVAVTPLDDLVWIRVTGSDRVRWLNGMLTNSIQSLAPGQGNYSFALNAQGQIQGDLNTFATSDALLLETAKDRVPTLLAHFDRFIIMDDVELEDTSTTSFGLTVIGPCAAKLLTRIGLSAANPGALTIASYEATLYGPVDLVSAHSPLVPRFELWSTEPIRNALLNGLSEHARDLDGSLVSQTALEQLRLLEGTPRFGTDIHDKTLAQETAQTRALHFSKGCYLGQEIVERIRSRGNLHRAITTFRLNGHLPPAGTAILADGKPVAELTSVAAIPLSSGTIQLGLGLARREAIERGTPLIYLAGSTQGEAVPVLTPIQPSAVTSELPDRITQT